MWFLTNFVIFVTIIACFVGVFVLLIPMSEILNILEQDDNEE